jgi:uncharacterized protein (DUF3084 family)
MPTISDPPKADANYSHDDLRPVLAAFEESLLAPTVSGELTTWLEQVQKSWEEASAQIHFHAKHLHPRQYDEISKQDPELFPRIEQLQAEDEAIEQQRAQLSQAIGRVCQHAPKLEPDEEKAQKYIKTIVDDGTAFLIRVRKQEVAVQTWYVEAFNRDGGAVD